MADEFTTREDFWRVSGYSYPNLFSSNVQSKQAWLTFLSFFQFGSYSDLKAYWKQGHNGRSLSHQAVESWKATFEEFGLLYVLSGADEIIITPGGQQFFDAASALDRDNFEWIGINLLLRYPLRGGRRPKNVAHGQSDLFPYQFFYSALVDLGGVIHWTELERILSKVFFISEGEAAVNAVSTLRGNVNAFSSHQLPVKTTTGGFYNSLNQFVMHASMGYSLFSTVNETIYPSPERNRSLVASPGQLSLLRSALAAFNGAVQEFSSNLSASPSYSDQQLYFDKIGAKVASKNLVQTTPTENDTTTESDDLESDPPKLPEELKILNVKAFTPTKKSPKAPSKNGKSGAPPTNKSYRKSKNSKIIGDRGEALVLKYERERLIGIGRPDLADKIVHEAQTGNTPGWDISSFDDAGESILIEVKSTVGKVVNSFFLTVNEWNAAKLPQNREKYYIYIVLDTALEKGARIETIRNPYQLVKDKIISVKLESVSIIL